MNDHFAGRKALVVGGSGGIGAAVARLLAAYGAQVIVHGGASADRVRRTVHSIRAAGGQARGILLPISSVHAVSPLLAAVPDPDIVVLAFGPFIQKKLSDTQNEDWDRMATLNLAFPGALASAVLPGMAARKYGRLLFFGGSSTEENRGFLTTAAYSAAKTGLNVLVKSIALQYAGTGVSALLIAPGFVDVEYLSDESRAKLRARAPGAVLIQPEAIAQLAVALLRDDVPSGSIVAAGSGLVVGRAKT